MMAAAIANPDSEELCSLAMQLCKELSAKPQYAEALVTGGLFQDIQTLTKVCPYDEEVLRNATACLNNLVNADTAKIFFENGGADITIESVLANMGDAEALLDGFRVFPELASDAAGAGALREAGAIDALLKALTKVF